MREEPAVSPGAADLTPSPAAHGKCSETVGALVMIALFVAMALFGGA